MSSSPPASSAAAPPSSPPSSVPSDDNSEDEMVDVQPSEVEFLDTLKRKRDRKNRDGLVITFKVKIRGKICVMKVFKGDDFPGFDYFVPESSAYRLLKEKGFCRRGVVPKFYGTIENMNVDFWPDLCEFDHHEFRPSAVLMEYIPNAEQIGLSNFSQSNIDRLSQILFEFHDAGLLHGDPYPRNMMVVPGAPLDRVFWLDFDCAVLAQRESCDEWTEQEFKEEVKLMNGLAKDLAEDAKNGKLEAAKFYYY